MACEKYAGWMTDAAFGELRSQRKAEMFVHMGECEACRNAYTHAQEVASFVDRAVGSLVEGEPSPQFVARFRSRLAEGPAPARWAWATWTPVAASALALAGVLMFAVIHAARSGHSNLVTSSRTLAPPSAPATAGNFPAPIRGSIRPSSVHPAGPPPVRSSEPVVLVDRGQLAAVMQFADAIAAGHVNGKQLISAQQEIEEPLVIRVLEIQTLEIRPMKSATEDVTHFTDDHGGL
jgi:anti-sigma factor RsiW